MTQETLSNLLQEDRTFPPSEEFAAQANGTQELYDQAAADREGFWADQARKYLTWDTDFDQVLDWSEAPVSKWFVGGKLNAAVNCLDRHVEAGNGDRVAIHFVGEPGDTRDLTYADLHDQVQRAANVLAGLGVGTGDRVAIYLPMIPEAVVAMLACARLGAPHSVVFGGFSADALRSRIADGEAKVVITTHFNSKQRVFLDFVLAHYVKVGVEELDQDKLTPLLKLKYHDSIADAVTDLGESIGRVMSKRRLR